MYVVCGPIPSHQPSPMTVEVSWDSTPWDTASSICSALEAAATCRGARAHATSDAQLGALFAALKKIPSDWESKLATASQQGTLLSWLRQAMQYCHHVSDSCKQVQWERKKVQLVEVRAKLAEWAGGAKNGESWKDRIPETVGPKTWSLLELAHREHLSQLDTMEWVSRKKALKKALTAYERACGKSNSEVDIEVVKMAKDTMDLAAVTLTEGLLMDCLAEGDAGASSIQEAMEKMVEDRAQTSPLSSRCYIVTILEALVKRLLRVQNSEQPFYQCTHRDGPGWHQRDGDPPRGVGTGSGRFALSAAVSTQSG